MIVFQAISSLFWHIDFVNHLQWSFVLFSYKQNELPGIKRKQLCGFTQSCLDLRSDGIRVRDA
jgi:hypothetical protein